MQSASNIHQLVDHLFRHESGKIVSVLTHVFGADNMDLAEDVVQDALMEALHHWPLAGIPANPAGWLYKVSRNKAINAINRDKHQRQYAQALHPLLQQETSDEYLEQFFSQQEIADDQLRMIFTCCHPAISPDAQVALTLKTLCGFSIREIANAFLTSDDTIHKRLVRARQTLREHHIGFDIPAKGEIEARLDIVLKAIYLLFNEGYSASAGTDVIRFDFCLEAIRLTELMVQHDAIPLKTPVHALLALMQLNASRFETRQNDQGGLLTLAEQDRSRWNKVLIQQGLSNLEKGATGQQLTIYHILGTISAYHCIAPDFASTDWKSILVLYDNLLLLDNSPVVLLNRAIVLARVNGAGEALAELEKIGASPALQGYHLYYFTKGELHRELEQQDAARACFEQALQLARLPAERALIEKRLAANAGK